ncbi:MAG: hypothetical protein ACOVQK_02255 [Cyanobium sp.]|jgi:hypothetical protein
MEASQFDDFDKDASEASSDEQATTRRSRRRFRILFDGGAIALFGIFFVHLIPVLLKTNPTNIEWQGEFVDVLVNEGLLAFLGFVLLHLAGFIQPSHDRLRRRLRMAKRLAVLAVVGYLLLVPLQIWSSVGSFASGQSKRSNYLDQGTRLSEIREALQGAGSVQDLNVRLQSLLQPALNSEQLAQPLPELRKVLLNDNEAQQQKLNQLQMLNAEGGDFFAAIVRVGSAVGWALAFASGAVPWGSHSTLIERLRRRGRTGG